MPLTDPSTFCHGVQPGGNDPPPKEQEDIKKRIDAAGAPAVPALPAPTLTCESGGTPLALLPVVFPSSHFKPPPLLQSMRRWVQWLGLDV